MNTPRLRMFAGSNGNGKSTLSGIAEVIVNGIGGFSPEQQRRQSLPIPKGSIQCTT